MSTAAPTELGTLVRRHDPDRFFCALFAPPSRREVLFTLYAFNHELARAREAVREPTMALIRLQWWREVVSGARRRHEVAGPLGQAIDEGALLPADLMAMVDGREPEAEAEIASLAEWQDFLRGTAGAVAVAAGRALGGRGAVLERLRDLGTAYGVAGQLRSVGAFARQDRCLLPTDLLGTQGLTAAEVIARPDDKRLAPVRAELAGWGQGLLREAGGFLPRNVLAAALPASFARRDLRNPDAVPARRGVADKGAVTTAFLTSRV